MCLVEKTSIPFVLDLKPSFEGLEKGGALKWVDVGVSVRVVDVDVGGDVGESVGVGVGVGMICIDLKPSIAKERREAERSR